MKWKTKLGYICITGFVAACGSNSGSNVGTQANNNINAKGNGAIQTANYATDCSSAGFDLAGIKFPGSRTEYDLSDLNFTKKQLYYTDDCKTQAVVLQEKGQVGVVGPSGAVPGALEENFNFQQTTIILSNDAMVKAFNLAKICGFNDWQIDVEKDVSGQANQALCPGKGSPRTAPELVLIQNSNLYLGGNTDRDVSQGRPTSIDQNTVFKKQ